MNSALSSGQGTEMKESAAQDIQGSGATGFRLIRDSPIPMAYLGLRSPLNQKPPTESPVLSH